MTGRSSEGEYFDPDLVIPLVVEMHQLEHQSWDAAFADGVDGNPATLRLRRMAHLLVRLGEFHEHGVIVLPTPFIRQLGKSLHLIADEIEWEP